jgi:hypothetical protein
MPRRRQKDSHLLMWKTLASNGRTTRNRERASSSLLVDNVMIAVFLFELSDFDHDDAGSPASLGAVEVN